MKKFAVLAVLPIFLFALETVNLIKDHSFEKDSEVWHTRLGGSWPTTAFVSHHDMERSYDSYYSGSCDTRPWPNDPSLGETQNAYITQGFRVGKTLEDLDSLYLNYSTFYLDGDVNMSFLSSILLYLNANSDDYWKIGYILRKPNEPINQAPHYAFFEAINFTDDTLWHLLTKGIYNDAQAWGSIPMDATLDSIIFEGTGVFLPPSWYSQKVFFDDIRLMGYADYDVGVKAILDPVESCEQSPDGNSSLVPSYTPVALIKNFGRENAEFAVIAEIYDGDTQVYYDSLPWSLTSDTEDTVTFASFDPENKTYTLTIRTFMEPDESDADDQLSKELDFTGITEVVTPSNLSLDIANTLTSFSSLRVSYSLPANQTGTISVYDPSGRRIQRQAVTGMGKLDLNIQLPAGIYIVRLESGGEAVSHKAVVLN